MRREPVAADTTAGRIRGVRDGRGCAFKGAPYGRSPAGALRLKAPLPPEPWTGERDCSEFGAASVQSNADLAMMGAPDVMALLFDPPEWLVRSEDCLNLNIWTPALDGAKRPVMVWLHSGGFFSGTASTHKCAGAGLSAGGDVVVVTVNHRLGLLGFLHLEDLCGEAWKGSGNAGLLDLVAALEWVRDNIATFGGDPDNVTIFGESGGGGKVNALTMTPRARGLFHKAILQSGPWLRYWTREDATMLSARVLDALGLTPESAGRLHDLPVEQIAAAQTAVMGWLMQQPISLDGAQTDRAYGPVCDGDIIAVQPDAPGAAGGWAHVPLLIGTTKDEGTFMLSGDPEFPDVDEEGLAGRMVAFFGDKGPEIHAAYRAILPDAAPGAVYSAIATDLFLRFPSIVTAERKAAAGGAPVFMYRFDYETSVLGGRMGAPHGIEIPFVFDTVDVDPLAGVDPRRFDLAEQVRAAWAAFARTGNPGNPRLPEWPAYDLSRRATMTLAIPCAVADDPGREGRLFWTDLARNRDME
jgi:para-nitrobenzyl esterase